MKEKIRQDLKEALKSQRNIEVSTLRLVLAAVLNKEKEKRAKIAKTERGLPEEKLVEKSQLSQDELVEVIFAEVKKRKEALLDFERGKREDLVKLTEKELDVLQNYLPKQLSREEILDLIEETIKALRAEGPKDMGRVMGELMPKVKGRAEGKLVSKLVKDLLTK